MSPTIKVLAVGNNAKGDLFARLMKDLFLAMGYADDVRLNIQKSGREIDLEARHRVERRRAIAECKATANPIGGRDINEFVGILDGEKRRSKGLQTSGFFISLSGFTETAIEQEKEYRNRRVILFDSARIANELIKGRIIVDVETAMERAGRCVSAHNFDLEPQGECELLGHSLGWVWAIHYGANKERTHLALIHADGAPLALEQAEEVIATDRATGGQLHLSTYLSPARQSLTLGSEADVARNHYYRFLAEECGEILLEGLPADQEVGSRRLELENIFVPLHVVEPKDASKPDSDSESDVSRRPVGEILTAHCKIALLAAPGGGKSTLLKRLAVAYAFPDRRQLVNDALPDRKWMPLFIRCRQLGQRAFDPITQILYSLAERVELGHLGETFKPLIDGALRNGEAILLVDGLDEISDPQARLAFVGQLRVFLATYPNTSLIVTSREAGFRLVARSFSSYCQQYTLADFDNDDIKRLTIAWHKEVIGDRSDVMADAEKLAVAICDSDRVRRLAKNPLLLTTLLLVKRWVGQLPTRRTVLYGKAIEVLLMTWNVEGYEPLDQDEVIPQLAFVAFQMMRDGVQRVSSRRLKELLILARKQMPEILSYAKLSVNEFIERVELRSSLLMLSGHTLDKGTLVPEYEFRHLTFQEYLTATAIVEGFYPDRKDSDSILDVIEPYLLKEHWKEVVPLTAVLAGRKAQPLIQQLISSTMDSPRHVHITPKRSAPHVLLAQCLLDEVLIPPDTLKIGLEWVAKRSNMDREPFVLALADSKYGEVLRDAVKAKYVEFADNQASLGSALGRITLYDIGYKLPEDIDSVVVSGVTQLLKSNGVLDRARGALAVMIIAYNVYLSTQGLRRTPEVRAYLISLGNCVSELLWDKERQAQFAAAWALCWIGVTNTWVPTAEVVMRLLTLWMAGDHLPEKGRMVAWALAALPIVDHQSRGAVLSPTPDVLAFIKDRALHSSGSAEEHDHHLAAAILAYYFGQPWTPEELAQVVLQGYRSPSTGTDSRYKSLLQRLSDDEHDYLQELEAKRVFRMRDAIDTVPVQDHDKGKSQRRTGRSDTRGKEPQT